MIIYSLINFMVTVKRLINGGDLFGEIGEFKKFAKISRRQIKTLQSLYIPVLEITKLIICQIVIFEKPANKIAAKYSCFTTNNHTHDHDQLYTYYGHRCDLWIKKSSPTPSGPRGGGGGGGGGGICKYMYMIHVKSDAADP